MGTPGADNLSDWKTGNGRPIRIWPLLQRASFWLEEPSLQDSCRLYSGLAAKGDQ